MIARPRPAPPLPELLLSECDAMLRWAYNSGTRVPDRIVNVVVEAAERLGSRDAVLTPAQLASLGRAHGLLSGLVAPATPRTILLLSRNEGHFLRPLGPVRLVRHMLVAVMVLLAGFVVLATSTSINKHSGDILNSHGTALLLNELFFIACGGLGAAFANLFRAYRYISDGTYDPKYESSYWIRFILGLIAGVLLPSLIPIGGTEGSNAIDKPLLALLGGFSAAVLYRILDRIVDTVESLFAAGGQRDAAPSPPPTPEPEPLEPVLDAPSVNGDAPVDAEPDVPPDAELEEPPSEELDEPPPEPEPKRPKVGHSA